MGYIGDYTFADGTELQVFKGPKVYKALLWFPSFPGGSPRREIRDKDLESLYLRAMGLVKRYSESPWLIEERVEGEPMPFPVETEGEHIRKWIREDPAMQDVVKGINS